MNRKSRTRQKRTLRHSFSPQFTCSVASYERDCAAYLSVTHTTGWRAYSPYHRMEAVSDSLSQIVVPVAEMLLKKSGINIFGVQAFLLNIYVLGVVAHL
ncbi:hypothetical protein NPIL_2311 [Nephila pilipes]|uniref:Uncharacterized protein n=1 Tax=Nephila pilipes TaxID=299642 RepID=A0A8X6TN55_NEPPI|nr:hypothetical protein NPIL_2311 [Nephila pilipes]